MEKKKKVTLMFPTDGGGILIVMNNFCYHPIFEVYNFICYDDNSSFSAFPLVFFL